MNKLDIQTKEEGNVRIVELSGSLDTDTADLFDETFAKWIAGGSRCFVVDVARLEYISSAGIGVLVGSLNQLQEIGGDLRLVAVPPRIKQVLDMLALLELFASFPNQPSAIASYSH